MPNRRIFSTQMASVVVLAKATPTAAQEMTKIDRTCGLLLDEPAHLRLT